MDQDLSMFQNRKRRKRIARVIWSILLVALFFAALWFALDRWVFKVRNVAVSPSQLYSEEQLIAACKVEEGTRLFALDREKIKENIENQFPFLTNVTVRLRLPHTVSVSFEEKMGEIALNVGDGTFAVDADLTVLARISAEESGSRLGLKTDGVSRCIVGEKIQFFDTAVPGILSDLVQALDEAKLLGEVRSLDLRDKFNIRIDYKGQFNVLLGEDEDLDLKLAMIKRVAAEQYEDDAGEIDITDPNNAYVRLHNRG
ncbi:MAG: FtsQ-type POTRA domain-containing protein [Clostridia bacterium]|nr:FtsQ-type POTRA domain-containing protein [Clostridia bacterium]